MTPPQTALDDSSPNSPATITAHPLPTRQVILRELSHLASTNTFTVSVTGADPSPATPTTVTLTSPFTSPSEERDLQWYCETSDREPFSVIPRLDRSEQSLHRYGTHLFTQVFPYPDLSLPASTSITVRVVGSPSFCSLHWELLRDPFRGPVALDLSRCLVRQASTPDGCIQIPHPIRSYPTLNVLFLTARRRTDDKDIPLRIESLAVMDSVRDHHRPMRFDLVRPGTIPALLGKLTQAGPGFYHILHLDCHGAGGVHPFDFAPDRIVFETERAEFTTVGPEDIAAIVDTFRIPIVVTSACRSGMSNSGRPSFAYQLFASSHVQCVVAMALSVLVDTTARFVRKFYRAMLDCEGRTSSVRAAMRTARLAMFGNKDRNGVNGVIKRQDWWIPQLFERPAVRLEETGLFVRCSWEDAMDRATSPEERALLWEDSQVNVKRKNLLNSEPVDEKKFLGRNEVLRVLECKVFSQDRTDNVILLWGPMGSGKTAFITYVSWWWCVTGLVRDKFVFRIHEKSYSLNQMIWHIYRQLFNVANYDPTIASKAHLAENRRRVTEHLRLHNYVIVIDSAERLCTRESKGSKTCEADVSLSNNFESEFESDSEDGRGKARTNPREHLREDIAKWLADLQGGKTIVLVGFRGSSESELMKYIEHKSNKLDLATIVGKYPSLHIGTLSEDWSRALVKQILNENGVGSDPRYEALHSFQMLDLYGGNPLVISLMVGSFRIGDVGLAPPPEDLYEKLQKYLSNPSAEPISVKPSLEYSFNLLSTAQQKALLFLAPFKGSVTAQGLVYYADALEKDSESFPTFNREAWDSAIRTAVRWGLLTYHERMRPQPAQQAWRIHAYLSLLLMGKLCHEKAPTSRGSLGDLSISRGYGVLDYVDKDAVLRPMVKAMHTAYWKLALQFYDDLRHSEKPRHDRGRVMTEIEFWNLKRVLKYALEEKRAFYGILLPLYWYLAAKNDITQRYELCRRVVEKVGTFDNFKDIPLSNDVYRMDIPRAYHIFGMLLGHNRLHRLAEAERWFNRTIKIWRTYGNKSELAVTEHELGWVAMNRRDYQKARAHYNKALELSDRLGQARTMHNFGLLEAQEGNFEKAVEYHDNARVIYEEQGDVPSVASAYHHMAIASARMKMFEEAERYAKNASASRKERDETKQKANAYQLRGNIAQRRAREEGTNPDEVKLYLDVAKRKYNKAMVAYNCNNGYQYGVIPEREMLHENYGLLMATQCRFLKDPVERIESQKTEMASYLRLNDGKYPKAMYNLGLIFEEMGSMDEAFQYYSRAAELMPTFVKDTVEWEACRRAHLAKAKCLAKGEGVSQDEHEAISIVLRVRDEIGENDPLMELGLPVG